MSGLVLTLPIAAGKVEAWRRFCQELRGSQRLAYEASRLRLRITHERLSLVDSPFGATFVTTLEAPDVAWTVSEMIRSDRPFERLYRERFQDLSGVNLASYEKFARPAPPADRQELLFEWRLPGRATDLGDPYYESRHL